MYPVYITSMRVPGVLPEERIEWTSICHRKAPFLVIDHDTLRPTSRWQWVERKKPFSVTVYGTKRHLHRINTTWYPTLAKAREGAARKAAEWHAFYTKEQAQ